MLSPPVNRVELILFADQDMPLHLWLGANEDWARSIECGARISIITILGFFLFFFFGVLLSPTSILFLVLLIIMVIIPAYIIGAVGFFRGF